MLLPRWLPIFVRRFTEFGRRFTVIVPASRTMVLSSLLVASARAHTWIVGPGSGTNFPDLPSAIAGSQPGDVLVVRPASYAGGFTLDKGLTILGYGSVSVSGLASITGIPDGQRAVVIGLSVAGFQVDGCVGPVVVQDLHSNAPGTVSASSDVRLLRASVGVPYNLASPAVAVSESRVEIVDSQLDGVGGSWNDHAAMPGLVCDEGSRVHVVRSDVVGGNGVDTGGDWWLVAGDGAVGIRLASSAAELILAGGGIGRVVAGDPGLNLSNEYCCQDGEGHEAVSNVGPVRYSGVTLLPSYTHEQSGSPGGPWCCTEDPCSSFVGGGSLTAPSPDDPTLSISGTPTNGGSVTLTVTGPAGAHAWLELGRQLAITPDPDSPIEELVDPISTLDLGTIPASGQASFVFGMPGFVGTRRYQLLPPGAFFAAQGLVTLQVGGRVRTNSIPIVGR